MGIVCSNCGRELREEYFEKYKSRTRRRVCRHCHYLLHTKAATKRWRMLEKARTLFNR